MMSMLDLSHTHALDAATAILLAGDTRRDQFDARLSNPITVKQVTCALELGVFGSGCLLARVMLTFSVGHRRALL